MFKSVDNNIIFPEMEKKWLKHWYGKGIVKKYLQKNASSKKRFSFIDGPITANNPMAVHHAWGRTYKDLWQKFHNLLGFKQRFQNGFDCQGLWVEVEVEKELGLKSKKDIENLVSSKKASIAKFVDLCKQRVLKFSGIQTEQTKRLGNFMDWDNSYFTMSDENNYMIWHFLKKCHDKGWIYKGHESVPWCPRCETAISQHEMLTEDYKEITHEAIYLELPLVGRKREYLLVWTTTPWTIPANIAVAVDKDLDYSLIEGMTGDYFWVARDLVESVFQKNYKNVKKTVKGKELVGLHYEGPFDDIEAVAKVAKESPDKFHTVIPTDKKILPISVTEGTGLVHTAVSAGVEDFKLGKKYSLPMIPVIADNADYLPGLSFLSGKNAKKHPRIILDYLLEKEKNNKEEWVFKIHNYTHRYPACWRCKTELVWKVADEWYIAMDKPSQLKVKSEKLKVNSTLRQRMMEVAKKIAWMPSFGLERELDWLKNMHDWLISKKNRYWGLALPIYECLSCERFEVIGSKEELRSRAVDGWAQFEGHSPHKPFIDDVLIECKICKKKMSRINDVGNPWLDAGIVTYSTITEKNIGKPLYLTDRKEWMKWFPADFITESFPGQFKNWFYALIAESTALENREPFKRVLGFGTLLGEDGRPMHKSWGNAVEFNEGADKIGSDVMRWMFARHNPSENMLFGYKKADEVRRQFYLMIWNIYKFFVEYSNLDKWKPDVMLNSFQHLITDKKIPKQVRDDNKSNILDSWIVSRLVFTTQNAEKSLKDHDAKAAALGIESFVSDLSTWYVRRSRERVWLNSEDGEDKRAFYATFYSVLVNLSIILSPFMPFLSEEIYTSLTGKESVHLSEWPVFETSLQNQDLELQMSCARSIVELGNSLRKEYKIKIRQPLQYLLVKGKTKIIKSEKIMNQVLKELNIKELVNVENQKEFVKRKTVKSKESETISIWIDTEITEVLKKEGEARGLVREIQELRKKLGVKPHQSVNIVIPKKFADYAEFLKKKIMIGTVTIGEILDVTI